MALHCPQDKTQARQPGVWCPPHLIILKHSSIILNIVPPVLIPTTPSHPSSAVSCGHTHTHTEVDEIRHIQIQHSLVAQQVKDLACPCCGSGWCCGSGSSLAWELPHTTGTGTPRPPPHRSPQHTRNDTSKPGMAPPPPRKREEYRPTKHVSYNELLNLSKCPHLYNGKPTKIN